MSASEVSSKEPKPTGYGLDEFYSKLGIDNLTDALELEVRQRIFQRELEELYTPKELERMTPEERHEAMGTLHRMTELHTLPEAMGRALVAQDLILEELKGLRKDLHKEFEGLGRWISGVGEDIITYGLLPIRDRLRLLDLGPLYIDEGQKLEMVDLFVNKHFDLLFQRQEWMKERKEELGKADDRLGQLKGKKGKDAKGTA